MTVEKLANELHTSKDDVLLFASRFNLNDEKIEGDEVPRIIENFVRTQHLKKTHPDIFRMLDKAYSSDIPYERWICAIKTKIGGA